MMSRPKLLIALVVGAIVAAGADLLLVRSGHHATPLPASGLVGYWPFFAVFWFLVFVFASKWIGKAGIQQPEDYYESTSGEDERGDDDAG